MIEPGTELGKLSTNTALVTGASSGFGLAIAARLATEGCALHLADGNETDLEQALEAIPFDDQNEPETHATDLNESINAAVLALECEEVDILVNTPPSPPTGEIDDLDHEDWRQAFEETVLSAINLTREVYESMQEIGSGLIINIGCSEQPGDLCQDTVNAALRVFSENLDRTAARHGVRVLFRLPSPQQGPKNLADEVVGQILERLGS